MVNPREYTCRLLEMADSGILSADDVMNAALLYMSDSDVEDMMRLYQWDSTIDEDGTEENDSEEETEITVGSTVIVEGGGVCCNARPRTLGLHRMRRKSESTLQ